MSDTIITVENLSKKYTIGHQKQARYGTFRESLNHMGRGMLQQLRHPLSPNKENIDLEEFWALDHINFEIKQGDRVGIIGRNGAGKSTLLKILSRITEPTSGRVTIKGRVASLLEVGTGFHPELTGRENVFLNGAILGMSRVEIKKKFDEIVDFAEIEKFLDTPVKRYSSGMYVRLAFAVAAHLEPEILLVDEVLSVGDAEFQKKCMGKMEEAGLAGRTIVFVSHNLAAITKICRRCILIDQGRINCDEKAHEVVNAYLNQNIGNSSGIVKLQDGNKMVTLNEAAINNSQGDISTHLAVDKNFWVKVEFSVKKSLENAQVAVAITTKNGDVIFVTTNRDANPEKNSNLAKKTYRAKVQIPGNFLNIGTYIVNLRIFSQTKGEKRHLHATALQILRFTIHETGSIASILSDHRGGLVTPILDWTLE